MTSELAKEAIEQMWNDGLKPTVEDIVRLNALGLKAEHGDGSDGFDYLPRMAFLGDLVFSEPTLAKRIWLDTVGSLLADDYTTRLFMTAFALNCPDKDLPPCDSIRKVKKAIATFKDDELLGFTETEICGAIQYALTGASPDTGEDADRPPRKDVRAVPDGLRSVARAVLAEAVRCGFSYESSIGETREHVESLIALSLASKNGAEFVKSVRLQYIGEFNYTADKIRERLEGEKNGKTEH